MPTFDLHLHRCTKPEICRVRASFSEIRAPYEELSEVVTIFLPIANRVRGEFLFILGESHSPSETLFFLQSGRFLAVSSRIEYQEQDHFSDV